MADGDCAMAGGAQARRRPDAGGAAAGILCLEPGCPNPPAAGSVCCAACRQGTTRGPLYARPHRLLDTGSGKCEVCGRDNWDGIHPEELHAPGRQARPLELG